MGLTCKPYGKYESMFKKLDNQLAKAREEFLKRRSTSTDKKEKKKSN